MFSGANEHGRADGGVSVGAGIGKTQQHALDPGLCSGACILGVLPHEKGRGEPRGPVAAGAAAAWRRGVLGGPGHPKI